MVIICNEEHGVILHNFPAVVGFLGIILGYSSFLVRQINLNKPVVACSSWFAYMWTSSPVISPNHRGHTNQTLRGNALFELCSCFLDHQQSRRCSPSRRCSELWHKHLYFTISTRKQTVAWHQISLSFSGFVFLSPLSLLFFLLNYFYNGEKHLGGWYQETKNRAYYSSVVTSQRFKPVF